MITPSTTHQQTQMIANTTEGIYQNTLTIAQSVTGDNLYGLYSCMVENSRGSSNRIEYFYGESTNTQLESFVSITHITKMWSLVENEAVHALHLLTF